MSDYDYDLFVIGGGSGGVRAGRLVAAMGKKVGVAEQHRWGGTCVIRGCVPKKLMVYASHFPEEFEIAKTFGWSVGEASFDWNAFIANKDKEIARLEGLYKKGLLGNDAEAIDSRAELRGAHEIYLTDEKRTVTADKIMIAVGGTPNKLSSLDGSELCISSDEVFHLEAFPKDIVINGGGYIAVEFACIFNGLGSNVTLIYRGEEILRGFDNDVREHLHREMEAKGVTVMCNTQITSVADEGNGRKSVTIDSGDALQVDQVMLAVGRNPLTNELGLDKAGVEMDAKGFIAVDEFSKTNVDNIWAVGDVTNRISLTPVAIHESMCWIETEFHDTPTKPDHELVATAVFSQPEIGTIGLGEEEAAQNYPSLKIYKAMFRPMKNTLSDSQEKMMMKIIVDDASDRVVGLHVMGYGAGEMAQTLGIAIKMGATKADFDRTMAVHPTASEELVTMYAPSYLVKDGKRQDV